MSSDKTSPKVLTIAICLYPLCTTLDFQGPIELLTCFSTINRDRFGPAFEMFGMKIPHTTFDSVSLSHTLEPVSTTAGPQLVPEKTYAEATEQFDILLIPGGVGSDPKMVPPELMEFVKRQAPGCKYILSVCSGSWILAGAGILTGHRATTNKMGYKMIVEATKDLNVTWVPKARWVATEDKRIWTSSGVTAGQDLGAAFLEHVLGKELAKPQLAWVELSAKGEEDDEYADYFGLV